MSSSNPHDAMALRIGTALVGEKVVNPPNIKTDGGCAHPGRSIFLPVARGAMLAKRRL